MQIVHLNTERTWRGGERQTFWLARELEGRGHQNWVACRPGFPLEDACQSAGLKTLAVRSWGEWDLWAALRLRSFLKKTKADILHAHTGHAVGLGSIARKGCAVRFLATRRIDFPLRRNFLSRWKYEQLDALAVISGKIQEVVEKSSFPSARLSVVPSGIDTTGYPSVTDRNRLREERGYSKDDLLIVQVAALVPHKDQVTLLKATKHVLKSVPRVMLLILGEGPLRNELELLARELGVSDRVRFLGYKRDALEHVAMADLFVFSSVEEGLGTALLDALALGVPTAATSAGGIPEIYGSASAPELSPPRNPEALAKNMLLVITDPEEAQRRVERGKNLADKFTVQSMTDRYEEIYQNLLLSANEFHK
jgi:glycosyltransferase involved in cell wall biosynthesis